ncbi:LysE family translocator [Vibrio marisflavi]|uniref:Cysteine/O-acetylserine efflux protein n=1 Tax=Vibrio marisflavi CECT 7928 TaxID=634439 RepID=A0ABM8ZZ59_9VIBR|nr:LysE family translocator [Vibrio marisflavi]CAH0536136.1 Cysteine/O-acetylserine efflux protein [Vibrio marisflavi CECT 7928]
MDLGQLGAIALFAFVTTFSPGPNNIMLMTSGANVGFVRTIPHMLGVVFGFAFMVILVGMGLTTVFHTYPVIHQVLKVVSLAYLFYLAYKIATSKPSQNKCDYKPLSFLGAASFQWVNPKGWAMALTAVSVYNYSASIFGLVIIACVFCVVNLPNVGFWTVAGKNLQRWLNSPTKVRNFNWVMAGLLVASTLPMM